MIFSKKLDKLSWTLIRTHISEPVGYAGYNFTLYDKDEVTIKKELFSKTAKGILKKIKRFVDEKEGFK